MDLLKILLQDKSIKTENEKRGWGGGREENKKQNKTKIHNNNNLSEALFKNPHFSLTVNTEIQDDFICAAPLREKEAAQGPVPEHTGPGWGGGCKKPHKTEKITRQCILEMLTPTGPVIQVVRAYYLCDIMWERPSNCAFSL